jgi:hypothetical protein
VERGATISWVLTRAAAAVWLRKIRSSENMAYGADPFTEAEQAEVLVVAVLPHPLHGRLVDKMIYYVRPDLEFEGQLYKLTWWAEGVAYYRVVASKR